MSNELIKPEKGELIGFLHGQGGAVEIPHPFERDIFLFDTFVAGIYYIKNISEIYSGLAVGDRLEFFREPNNPHDKYAISIQTVDGQKIGYIPRRDNIVFSRLLDAGKNLFGKITAKQASDYIGDNDMKIKVGIYLHE